MESNAETRRGRDAKSESVGPSLLACDQIFAFKLKWLFSPNGNSSLGIEAAIAEENVADVAMDDFKVGQ